MIVDDSTCMNLKEFDRHDDPWIGDVFYVDKLKTSFRGYGFVCQIKYNKNEITDLCLSTRSKDALAFRDGADLNSEVQKYLDKNNADWRRFPA